MTVTTQDAPRIGALQLRDMLRDGEELALLDVREEAAFSQGHLLLARSVPLSRIELLVTRRVPRRATRVVLTEEYAALTARAAQKLRQMGYDNVSIFTGGSAAWAAAGLPVFSGVNVPSKAFGEHVEHHYGTPNISADELAALIEAKADIRILDSRPFEEYQLVSIPGATSVPGAELVYRIHDLVPSPQTMIVVNCAGRTRSILGAQSLINAGVPNKVVALRDGTMGWTLAGHQPDQGQARRHGEASPAARDWSATAVAQVAQRFGVEFIDGATLDTWRAEADGHTLFVLDVRTAEEYAAGHIPGSVHAPGGQLVQATDQFVATLNARLVLVDDAQVRAVMTASWLRQMGWQVVVLQSGFAQRATETGLPAALPVSLQAPADTGIDPAQLQALLSSGNAQVIDLANSREYRKRHIPGAWFAVRSRLPQDLAALPPCAQLVYTSEDGLLAEVACADPLPAGYAGARFLRGGTRAWAAAGLPTKNGEECMASTPTDIWLRPYERSGDTKGAMAEYLEWEVNLLDMIERDGTLAFRMQ